MKTAHEAIAAMKAELERRLEELNPKQGEFAGRPLRAINPRTFPRESEIEKMLAFLDTIEAGAAPEKLVLKNELTGEVVVERTIPEYMRGADPEIAYACTKLLSAGWALIAPGFEGVDLEKFNEKIKTFQSRYKLPESISVKGAMAFMARMFYQYPNTARQWYDSLPKATMD